MPPSGDVAIVIPARNESDRIQATVKAAAGVPGADMIVVVDDGSGDDTGVVAENAGAIVLRHGRTRGKGAALETGAEAVGLLERNEDRPVPRHLLFLDADLAESAASGPALGQPVRDGQADMTIAVFSERVRAGGHGFVVALSGSGIRRATGWLPAQPLNGQRCLTRAAFEAARPLAPGWGVETGMTIDLLRLGLRVTEVEVPMAHRATGGDWHAQLHRARQFAGVAWALAVREPAVQTRVATARRGPAARVRRTAGWDPRAAGLTRARYRAATAVPAAGPPRRAASRVRGPGWGRPPRPTTARSGGPARPAAPSRSPAPRRPGRGPWRPPPRPWPAGPARSGCRSPGCRAG